MADLTEVIAPRSDQINSEDLIPGPMTITITGVKVSPGQEQPVSISFEGSQKVWRPCKTTSRILVSAWGADSSQFVGRSLTLFRDPNVQWGGMAVGGIRISHMSHIEKDFTIVLAESKKRRTPSVIKKLVAAAKPAPSPDALAVARSFAAQGSAAFKAWWASDDGKAKRDAIRSDLPALHAECAEADAALSGPADDPFGGPTEADLAKAAADARDAAERAAMGA